MMTTPVIVNNPKDTPGKTDDFLLTVEVVATGVAALAKNLREKYITETGNFENIKLLEISKWSPIVQEFWDGIEGIYREKTGKELDAGLKSDLIRLVITTVLGIRL